MCKSFIWLLWLVWLGVWSTAFSSLADPFRRGPWTHFMHLPQLPTGGGGDTLRQRQTVLLDLLLQVEKPLVNVALIELGKTLNSELSKYSQPDDEALRQFIARLHSGDVLTPADVYNDMDIEHARQLHGLYKMLVLANDWTILLQNICFARVHLQPVLLVQALRLALRERERDDTRQLVVPALNEILPQLFYDPDVIRGVENVQWQELVGGGGGHGHDQRIVDPSRGHALWAWLTPAHIMRAKAQFWQPWLERRMQMMNARRWGHAFMPVVSDAAKSPKKRETIALGGEQPHSSPDHVITPVLLAGESLLTSDVGLNILWKDIMIARQMRTLQTSAEPQSPSPSPDIIDNALDAAPPKPDTDGLVRVQLERSSSSDSLIATPANELSADRGGEIFVQSLRQMMARLNMETIASTLEGHSAAGGAATHITHITDIVRICVGQLRTIVDTLIEQRQIDRSDADGVTRIIGDLLTGRIAGLAHVFDDILAEIVQRIVAMDRAIDIRHIGNIREPVQQAIIGQLVALIEEYTDGARPYRTADIAADGIKINDIDVDRLLTRIETHDADMVNLLDTQLLQSTGNNLFAMTRRVLVRQQRINHRPFTISYDITSQRNQTVVVRTWLGAAVSGGVAENRRNFVLLDAFVERLMGDGTTNIIHRKSSDFVGTAGPLEVSTLREIYHYVMTGLTLESLVGSTACRLPHRLLLPRGVTASLPVQILVIVSPITATQRDDAVLQMTPICGLGIAGIGLDHRPLGYPLDRRIEDINVPNVLVKHDIIQHVELARS